ncbi:MAG: ParB/RepB/Spo0J family partition protein [Rhodobacter sp.]|nr:ParB/RepB/Spo0J family partition protein [Rhodobacter sp.]
MADRKSERRGLGRGLSALMADIPPADTDAGTKSAGASADRSVPIDRIRPNPNQPRRKFTQDQLDDLTRSIKEKGIIQPLILRTADEDGIYEIVAGERRWRAAQAAQMHSVPAIIRDYTDTEVLEVAIVENIQRADLNSIEEAAGYRQLMERFGHTQEKISDALGKSRSHIANQLRLLTLPETVQDMVADGQLSAGHARALVTTDDPLTLAKRVVAKGLSVRETEALVRKPAKAKAAKPGKAAEKDADTRALEDDLSAALGMKARIDHRAGGQDGQLSIRYGSLDQLDDLCRILTSGRG